MNPRLCLIALLLVACGKEAPQPEAKAKAAAVAHKPAPEKKLPPVPQGKLPKMDPEKAKFIAVPSTPKDPEVEKGETTAGKPKTVEKPAAEIKKAAPAAATTGSDEQAVPEIKKAEVPAARP